MKFQNSADCCMGRMRTHKRSHLWRIRKLWASLFAEVEKHVKAYYWIFVSTNDIRKMTPISNESTNLGISVYFLHISIILWSNTRSDGAKYSNIEGCEEIFSVFRYTVNVRRHSKWHDINWSLGGGRGRKPCSSAIGNEEDESRQRNLRSITDHEIISVLHQKQQSSSRRLRHLLFQLLDKLLNN